MYHSGVVASQSEAAEAGAEVLAKGGNAMDAAVATAFALSVVDPANCGLAGHGGALVFRPRKNSAVVQVDFNTRCPKKFNREQFAHAAESGQTVRGGLGISVPAAALGLLEAHRRYGRLSLDLVAGPAIKLAESGFRVSRDLARALQWAQREHGALNDEFLRIFGAYDSPLSEGSVCVQKDLARTLRALAVDSDTVFRDGWIADAVISSAQEHGGCLVADDLRDYLAVVKDAAAVTYQKATVHGAAETHSGFTVLSIALNVLNSIDIGRSRSRAYIDTVTSALRDGWRYRCSLGMPAVSPTSGQHTTHLCAADGDGGLASLTFTHGPLWFGSGIVAKGTGLVINSGASLLQPMKPDGELVALHYLTPVIVEHPNGAVHAIGSPGGHRIPSIVLQAIVDVVHYGTPLSDALMFPRVSVDANGGTESEGTLGAMSDDSTIVGRAQYYGPSTGLTVMPNGELIEALDPRFNPVFCPSIDDSRDATN